MADFAAAEQRYIAMVKNPRDRFVALLGLQCCAAAKGGHLIRFNPRDKNAWGGAIGMTP